MQTVNQEILLLVLVVLMGTSGVAQAAAIQGMDGYGTLNHSINKRQAGNCLGEDRVCRADGDCCSGSTCHYNYPYDPRLILDRDLFNLFGGNNLRPPTFDLRTFYGNYGPLDFYYNICRDSRGHDYCRCGPPTCRAEGSLCYLDGRGRTDCCSGNCVIVGGLDYCYFYFGYCRDRAPTTTTPGCIADDSNSDCRADGDCCSGSICYIVYPLIPHNPPPNNPPLLDYDLYLRNPDRNNGGPYRLLFCRRYPNYCRCRRRVSLASPPPICPGVGVGSACNNDADCCPPFHGLRCCLYGDRAHTCLGTSSDCFNCGDVGAPCGNPPMFPTGPNNARCCPGLTCNTTTRDAYCCSSRDPDCADTNNPRCCPDPDPNRCPNRCRTAYVCGVLHDYRCRK